jgi:hypothetical protein
VALDNISSASVQKKPPMSHEIQIDSTLIQKAQRLATGANIHRITTLIFQYQQWVYLHNSGHPKFGVYNESYERSLREFVRGREIRYRNL